MIIRRIDFKADFHAFQFVEWVPAIGLLLQQSGRYRRMAIAPRTTPRDALGEHNAIFDAAIARDANLACALNAQHIEGTLKVLRGILSPEPSSVSPSRIAS